MTRSIPFQDLFGFALGLAIQGGQRPKLHPMSRGDGTNFEGLWKLAASCWAAEPSHRPTAHAVVKSLTPEKPWRSAKVRFQSTLINVSGPTPVAHGIIYSGSNRPTSTSRISARQRVDMLPGIRRSRHPRFELRFSASGCD